MWYEPTPLALYRVHSASDSSALVKTGADIADRRMSIQVSQAYLPAIVAVEFSNRAREDVALGALHAAREMLKKGGQRDAVMAQIREGLKTSFSPRIAKDVVRLGLWAGLRWGKRAVRATRHSARTGPAS
jgi:hypothetical protein